MARILLLDDSPTMHRVVRLTFADDPRMEISVARTPAEADQTLSAQQPDLLIAYVRFAGMVDTRFFESLKFVTPRILLLAESEENLDAFTRAGFHSVLRKPFHSDELRHAVEELLAREVNLRMPEPSLSPLAQSESQTQSRYFIDSDDTVDFSTPAAPPRPSRLAREAAVGEFQSAPKEPSWNEPQLTMDLSFIQQSFSVAGAAGKAVAPGNTPSRPAQIDMSPPPSSAAPKAARPSPVPPPPPPPSSLAPQAARPTLDAPPPSRPARAAATPAAKAVEPAAWNEEPMTLEDVMISARVAPNNGVSRQDIEKIVEDAVAVAVNRAVRQALNETLPDLRQALVNEVSQRAVEQLSAELQSIKKTLSEQMVSEVRDVSAQWLRRETPNLAKDVIREEIRKVIEGL
ncbi:response regulator [bacterium]|nr:response regulator [bacterium]